MKISVRLSVFILLLFLWIGCKKNTVVPSKIAFKCLDWPTPLNLNASKPNCTNCTSQALTSVTSKMWATGSTLRVKMKGGSSIVRNKVQQYAQEWANYANIKFSYVDTDDAEIVITFDSDGISYSKIGTDATEYWFRVTSALGFQDKGTMHFGWLNDNTGDEEFRRTILHEFGHALGFVHEHQNPSGDIFWNKEVVYKFYSGEPNKWSKDKVDINIFNKYNKNETQFTNHDPLSIMHYAIDPSLTTNGYSVDVNYNLSEMDKAFAKAVYPPGTVTGNRVKVTLVTGGDDLRVNSQAQLFLKLSKGEPREVTISLNKGAGWGGNSTNIIEIPLSSGVSVGDVIECKLIFSSGKQFPWDTPDNWNVDKISVELITANNFQTTLSTQVGTPYVRFLNTGETTLFKK